MKDRYTDRWWRNDQYASAFFCEQHKNYSDKKCQNSLQIARKKILLAQQLAKIFPKAAHGGTPSCQMQLKLLLSFRFPVKRGDMYADDCRNQTVQTVWSGGFLIIPNAGRLTLHFFTSCQRICFFSWTVCNHRCSFFLLLLLLTRRLRAQNTPIINKGNNSLLRNYLNSYVTIGNTVQIIYVTLKFIHEESMNGQIDEQYIENYSLDTKKWLKTLWLTKHIRIIVLLQATIKDCNPKPKRRKREKSDRISFLQHCNFTSMFEGTRVTI